MGLQPGGAVLALVDASCSDVYRSLRSTINSMEPLLILRKDLSIYHHSLHSRIMLSMGTISAAGYWAVPHLPNIVSEWAGIVPLVAHLASRRYAHHSVGELALLGRLSLGLFPKLGVHLELA